MKIQSILFSLFFCPMLLLAEGTPIVLRGSLELEKEEAQADPYKASQAEIKAYFTKLEEGVKSLATGGAVSPLPTLSQEGIQFLNAVYLHCSSQKGVCRFPLEALLEGEIINSRLGKKVSCPSMTLFWQQWVASDMETRHNHAVKTGFIADTQQFRKNERPHFIKCKETIASETDVAISDTDFFRRRYQDGKILASIKTTRALLSEIEKTIGNLLILVGTRDATEKKDDGAESKKRTVR